MTVPTYTRWLVVLTLAVLAMVGCSRSQAGREGDDEPVTIRFMVWGRANEVTELRQALTEQFERDNPDIRIEIIQGGQLYQTKLATMLAADMAPDVFMVHDAFFPTLISNGLALPLDERIASDPDIDLADYFPEVVDLCRADGRLYMLPVSWNIVMLYYNKDHFDQAGLAYPDESWTWADLQAAAQKLTLRGPDGRVTQFGLQGPNEWLGYVLFLWQNGVELFDAEEHLVMARPEYLDASAEAWQYIADMALRERVVPSASAMQVLPANPFLGGRVSMSIGGTWANNQIVASWQDSQRGGESMVRWGIAPLPGQRQRATLFFGGSPVISASTSHPEQAWRLLKFFASDAWQEYVAANAREIPAKRAIALSPRWLDLPGIGDQVDLNLVLRELPFARPQPRGVKVAEMMEHRLIFLRDRIVLGDVRDIRAELERFQHQMDQQCPYCTAMR